MSAADNNTSKLQSILRSKSTKDERSEEVRTLTLRFASHGTALRFAALCERHGHPPAHGRDGVWHTVSAVFQNKAARSRLVSAWARTSMLVSE